MTDDAVPVTPTNVFHALVDLDNECRRLEQHGYRVDVWRIHPDAAAALAVLTDHAAAGLVPDRFASRRLEVDATLPGQTWAQVDWR